MNSNNLSSGGTRERFLRRRLLAAGVSPSSTASVCSKNTSTHVNSTTTSSSPSNVVTKTNKQPLLKENIIANTAKRRLAEGTGRKENKAPSPNHHQQRTLLQRRRMEPLSPITFNSPSSNGRVMVGKTYIKAKQQQSVVPSKHTSVNKPSSSSKSVVSKKYTVSDRLSNTPTVMASDEDVGRQPNDKGGSIPHKLNKTPLGVKVASLRKLHRPLRHVKSPQDDIEAKNEAGTKLPETLKQNRPSSRAALSKMMQLENESKRITNARASAEKKSVQKKQQEVANIIEKQVAIDRHSAIFNTLRCRLPFRITDMCSKTGLQFGQCLRRCFAGHLGSVLGDWVNRFHPGSTCAEWI